MKVIPLSNDQLFQKVCFSLLDMASGGDEIIANYFVVRSDEVGIAFCNKLFKAACRGVRVSLIVDCYGSMMEAAEGTEYTNPPLGEQMLNSLALVGVQIYVYHPITSSNMFHWSNIKNWSNFTRRNHNKNLVFNIRSKAMRGLVIGDGQWANEHFDGQMKGSNIFIESNQVFVDSFSYQQRLIHSEHVASFVPKANFKTADCVFDIKSSDQQSNSIIGNLSWYHSDSFFYPEEICFVASEIEFVKPEKRHTIQDYEMQLLAQARQRVDYCTPYFSPDDHLQSAFIQTGKKLGEELKILMGKFRHDPYLPYGVRKVAKNLLKHDISLFEFGGVGNIHYKDMVVDDICFIKTANGEGRSRFYNLETGVLIKDAKLAQKLRWTVEQDFANSIQLCAQTSYLNQHPWWHRPAKTVLCPLYFHHL